MKECSGCNEYKYEREFHWHVKGVRRKARCKTCANSQERIRIKKRYENEREIERAGISSEGRLFNPLITNEWKNKIF